MPLPFQTPGYEHLELSTQIVIAEALKRGVRVEVLDPHSQFLRLKKGKHVEHVESATKTSRDSYVTSTILGNKVVTKIFLKEHGLRTPEGEHFENYHDAVAAAPHCVAKNKSCVVKPNTTNYGVGITILRKGFTEADFVRALTTAFGRDSSIVVEEFIEGIECRFLVVGGQCVAVLQRIPANVVGDGEHTVRELVNEKNDSPLRGKGHKTPLENIEIDEVEVDVLREQKLTPETVLKKGHEVFLRRNSNISTGGDSIDYTDIVHEGYKRIAEKAAAAVDAKICGVDIICSDFENSPEKSNYAIIELNYNPVLYFHNFPYEGENRDVGKYILDLLGF
jgi:glutamate--cysteine ligase